MEVVLRWWVVGVGERLAVVPLPASDDPGGPASAVVSGPHGDRGEAVLARDALFLARDVMSS